MNKKFAALGALAASTFYSAVPAFAQATGTIDVDAEEQVKGAIDTVNSALTFLVPAAFVMLAITLLIRQTRRKLNG